MTDRKKIIEKAKKLKSLADRGVGGEQINAKEMFDRYVKEHKITEDELAGINGEFTEYAYMSDDEFMKEMIKEMLPASIGFFITKIFKRDTQYTEKLFTNTTKKYLFALEERFKFMSKKGK